MHSYDTRLSANNYYLDQPHNEFGLKSPSFVSSRLWQQIPSEIKNSQFINTYEPAFSVTALYEETVIHKVVHPTKVE